MAQEKKLIIRRVTPENLTEFAEKKAGKQFYFVLQAQNGKIIATGETYKRKASIESLWLEHFGDFHRVDESLTVVRTPKHLKKNGK